MLVTCMHVISKRSARERASGFALLEQAARKREESQQDTCENLKRPEINNKRNYSGSRVATGKK